MSKLHYIVSDYFATGEGRCISMMILYPEYNDDDYETKPEWYTDDNGKWNYKEGILKEGITEKVASAKAFIKEYGEWYARCAENLTREEFLNRYGNCIPEIVKNITDPSTSPVPYFSWKQQIYFNYS